MVIDSINNGNNYFSLHPLFKRAFEHLLTIDPAGSETGTKVLEEGVLKAIISEGQGRTKETALKTFECHNEFIDIQYCMTGQETIGWKSREDCVNPNGEYNSEDDFLFYNDVPDIYFTLKPGQFAIFFSGDVHAPLISDGVIKKVVMKVKR
jgi:YhcH/YjgK/YiaL family protein